MIAAEMGPHAKAGGLADVIGALPNALQRAGSEVAVILPGYPALLDNYETAAVGEPRELTLGTEPQTYRVRRGLVTDRLPLYLIDHPGLFGRTGIYGENGVDYADNLRRFALFGRAAAALCAELDPDVLHAHDWHAAMAAIAARADGALREALRPATVVFTAHNLAFQGIFESYEYPLLGLDWSWYSIQHLEFYGRVNLMKGAITLADGVSTVSPSYARETTTEPSFGYGLESVLREKGGRYVGILNGADYDEWDPARDKLIGVNYTPARRAGKKACLYELREELQLPHRLGVPVIGMVTRMVEQKGVDLVAEALARLLELDVQLVMLASGDPGLEQRFAEAARRYPERLRVEHRFDNRLAHRIQAGSDMFLMPSRYEPCGLTQMYALKYGTVPIVRATGGLKDTVTDFDGAAGNGFTFNDFSVEALLEAINRTLRVFYEPKNWRRLMTNCFKADFSWARAAKQYLAWFEQLRAARSS